MEGRERLFNKEAAIKKEGRVAHRQLTGYFRPSASPIDQILSLQRGIGNQAVQRLFMAATIQPKLRIGQPNDIYEQEADRVADEVLRMPDPAIQPKPT